LDKKITEKICTVTKYLPINGTETKMQRFYTMTKRGKICLKILSGKIASKSDVNFNNVTSKQIFGSRIKLAKQRLRKMIFKAGTYQITITNETDNEGYIENIVIDESCTGLIITLLFT
jgi:hypothetical protein